MTLIERDAAWSGDVVRTGLLEVAPSRPPGPVATAPRPGVRDHGRGPIDPLDALLRSRTPRGRDRGRERAMQFRRTPRRMRLRDRDDRGIRDRVRRGPLDRGPPYLPHAVGDELCRVVTGGARLGCPLLVQHAGIQRARLGRTRIQDGLAFELPPFARCRFPTEAVMEPHHLQRAKPLTRSTQPQHSACAQATRPTELPAGGHPVCPTMAGPHHRSGLIRVSSDAAPERSRGRQL